MSKRHLLLTAALCALACLLSASTAQARRRTAGGHMMPHPIYPAHPPLERGEERLRMRLVALDGKPIPGVRVTVQHLTDVTTTDVNGVATLENLPDQEVVVHIQAPDGRSARRHTRPGEVVLAIPSQTIMLSLGREPFGPETAWKVAEWVAGTPVSPSDAKAGGYMLCFPVAGAEVPLGELVSSLVDLHKKHHPDGLKTLIVLPPGEAPDPERFERIEGLSVGVDTPVLDEEGSPGYSQAIWGMGDQVAVFVGFDGSPRGTLLSQTGGHLQHIEAQVAGWLAEKPTEWTIEAVGPDGERLADARAMIQSGGQWAEIDRDEGGRLRARAILRDGRVNFVVWQAEGNLVASVRATAADIEEGVLRVALEQGVPVSGRLVKEDGQPAEGVGVAAIAHHPGDHIHPQYEEGYAVAKTGAEGEFTIHSIPADSQHIQVMAAPEGWSPIEKSVQPQPGQARVELGELVLRPADRAVEGVVVDLDGKPVAGATIQFHMRRMAAMPLPAPAQPLSAESDAEGRFRLEGLPRGQLNLQARSPEGQGFGVSVREGQDFAAIVIGDQARLNEMRQGQSPPPMRVKEWVRGDGSADSLKDKALALYIVGDPDDPSHKGILQAFDAAAKQAGPARFAAVVVYPPTVGKDTIAEDIAKLSDRLIVGADQPVSEGAPQGLTAALALAVHHQNRYPVTLHDRSGARLWNSHENQQWAHVNDHFRQQAALAAEALSAEVTVLDEAGEPVAGALVVPAVQHVHFYHGDKGRADGEGRLSLPSLMGPPPITVWALAPDRGLAGKAEVREEGAKVTIQLAPAPPVSGRIVDTDGNAVPGVSVRLSAQLSVENRGTFSIPHNLPAVKTGEDARFRVTWLPEQTRGQLHVQAEGFWQEQVRIEPATEGAAREVGDIVLARADKTVEFRFWTLDGKPFPNVRVQASGSNASAQSDAQGKATLEGVPDKEMQLNCYGQGASASLRAAPPGPHNIALATSAEVQQLRSQSGLQGHHLPMWRVSQWVVGEPVEREHLEGRNAAVALIEPAVSEDEAKALAVGMARWAGQHGPRGLVAVLVFPPDAEPERIKAMFPEETRNLHVGIDAPVADAEGAPGWTDAVWRGWTGPRTRLHLQDFRGNRRHHSQRERVEEELEEADRQMQAMMQQAPYEWRVAVEAPGGQRLTGERLEEVQVVAYSEGTWTQSHRIVGDRRIVHALRPQSVAWFICWSAQDNLARAAPVFGKEFSADTRAEVRLAPADEIQGRLVGPDEEPVPNATMRLLLRFENMTLSSAPGLGTATTDADGTFAFRGVPAGAAWRIDTEVQNMSPLRLPLEGKLDLGDVALAAMDRELKGLVLDAEGEPIRGITVRAHNRTAITDEEGRFEMAELPRGDIHVNAQMRVDNEHRYGNAHAKDGQEFAVLIVANNQERNTINQTIPRLRVGKWETGDPPEDLDDRVRLLYFVGRERRGDHEAILHSLNDFAMRFADDRFAAVAIYPPDYSREAVRADLEAVYSGLAGTDEPIEGAPGTGWTEALLQARGQGQNPVILSDRAGRAIWRFHGGQGWNPNYLNERTVQQFLDAIDVELTVVDPEGQPLAGARVSPAAQYSHFFQSVESGEDGGLSLRALQGPTPMPIAVFHTGRGLAAVVEAPRDGFAATVRLEAPPPVTGRVVTRDGELLAQAHVRPNVLFSGDGRGRWTVHHNEFVNTAADGTFRFDWIPADTEVRLHIHCGGHFNENILVELDERDMGDIALYKADQQATFTVLGLDGEPVAGVHVNAGGRGAQTGSDGKATVTGLPDKPVPVSVHGNIAQSVSQMRGPGEHTLAVVSAEQRQRLEAARRGAGTTPLWRVGKWVKGTPVDFDAAPPAMAIVVSETLDERGAEDLAERVARLGERFGQRIARLAFVLPHDTEEPAAERIAEMLEGFSVGLDQEIEAVGGVGYSQAVCSAFVSGSAFTAFVKTPDARQVQLVHGRGDLDQPLRRLEGLLDQFVSRLPPSPEARIAELKRLGELVSEAQDPFEEHRVWLVLKTGIARATPEEGLREWSSVLGMRQYRPVGLAFTERAVFIGTDQGLISFARATDSWNRIAPAGDYNLMIAPVKGIEQDGDRIAVAFETPDGGEVAHVLEGGRWK